MRRIRRARVREGSADLTAKLFQGTVSTAVASTRVVGHRHARWPWLVGVVLVLAYGSLIPLDIDPSAFGFSDGNPLDRLRWSYGGLGDFAINLLLYLPVGWLAVRCFAGPHSRILRASLGALALGAGLSLTIEVLQAASLQRVASWSDFLFNTCGTALGVILAVATTSTWTRLKRRVGSRTVRNPFAALASLLAVALWLYSLAPFDFVVTTEALQRSFLHASWSAAPVPVTAPANPTMAVLVGKMTTAAWFGVLAYLWVFACLWSSHSTLAGLTKAIAHTITLVWLVEFMQLFTASHVFEMSDILLRSLGATLGAWTAVFIAEHAGHLWKRRPSLVLPPILLVALAAFQMVAILLESYAPHGTGAWSVNAQRIEWMPFLRMWRASMSDAAMSSLSMLVRYGVLAVTLLVLVRRVRLRGSMWAIGLIVILLASTAEWVRMGSTSQMADITHPLLALVAVIGAIRGWRRFQEIAKSRPWEVPAVEMISRSRATEWSSATNER